MLHHADDWLTIHVGDNRAVLATLPAESVNCVITSPPYYGLRDYGTASWDGGDPECDHKPPFQPRAERANPAGSNMGAGYTGQEPAYRDVCGRCGATRQDAQLGLEATPDAYIAALVAVFREVRRVLRKDGTVWLNLGDSYAGSSMGGGPASSSTLVGTHHTERDGARFTASRGDGGLKPKDRMMIPARVAIALQADGWWLRDEIVWAKPNPMPSSVTDRTTPAHEMVYLLTKSARYSYDADAVREEQSDWTFARGHIAASAAGVGNGTAAGLARGITPVEAGRNKRSVWTVATQPYPEAHFATFPEALIEPMILAGCPERVCADCGAPWQRVVELSDPGYAAKWKNTAPPTQSATGSRHDANRMLVSTPNGPRLPTYDRKTTGWRPSCAHDADTRPGVVLDPFGGSGTVGLVAERLGRRSVLIDLSPDYAAQMVVRIAEGRARGDGPALDMPVPPADDGLWALAI